MQHFKQMKHYGWFAILRMKGFLRFEDFKINVLEELKDLKH